MGAIDGAVMLFYFLGAIGIMAFVLVVLHCTKKIVVAIKENTEQVKRNANIKSEELKKNRFWSQK